MPTFAKRHYDFLASAIAECILDNSFQFTYDYSDKDVRIQWDKERTAKGMTALVAKLVRKMEIDNPGFRRDRFIKYVSNELKDKHVIPNYYWGRIKSYLIDEEYGTLR